MTGAYDLRIVDGDLPHTLTLVTGTDLTIQRVRRRLATFRGEWVADANVGLSLWEWMTVKPIPAASISAAVRAAVETTPGVLRVTEWSYTTTPGARAMTITGRAELDGGDVLDLAVYPDADARNANPSHRIAIRARAIVASR